MHPGPMNRGVEIAADVADCLERSVIASQVSNGIHVRMSLLYLLLGGPAVPAGTAAAAPAAEAVLAGG
jgi:aspartate carbamoyltransferase catalytic subunit